MIMGRSELALSLSVSLSDSGRAQCRALGSQPREPGFEFWSWRAPLVMVSSSHLIPRTNLTMRWSIDTNLLMVLMLSCNWSKKGGLTRSIYHNREDITHARKESHFPPCIAGLFSPNLFCGFDFAAIPDQTHGDNRQR